MEPSKDQPLTIGQHLAAYGRLAESISGDHVARTVQLMPRALQVGGFLGTSQELCGAISRALADPRVGPERIARIVESDPVTLLRLLSLSNGARFSRGSAVDQLPVAITQLGLLQIGHTIEDLAEKHPSATLFLGRTACLRSVHHYLMTDILAVKLAPLLSPIPVATPLITPAAALLEMPALLLGYLRPNIAAALRGSYGVSTSKRVALCTGEDPVVQFERNMKRIFQKTIPLMAVEIGEALSIPRTIINLVSLTDLAPWNRRSWGAHDGHEVRASVTALYLAQRLASELLAFRNAERFSDLIRELARKAQLRESEIKIPLSELPHLYAERVAQLGLPPARLPSYLFSFGREFGAAPDGHEPPPYRHPPIATSLNPFLTELKTCLRAGAEEREVTRVAQAVEVTLQALVGGVGFDRAIFLRNDVSRLALIPEACFGDEIGDVLAEGRPVLLEKADTMPDSQALLLRRVVFEGDPIFAGSWPFVAFPAIADGETVGVFYADRREHDDAHPLEVQEQVATVAIAEEWRNAPGSL